MMALALYELFLETPSPCMMMTSQVYDAVRQEHVRNVGTVSDDEYMEAEEVGHKQRATCVKFSPDNKYQCVTGGWDRYDHGFHSISRGRHI